MTSTGGSKRASTLFRGHPLPALLGVLLLLVLGRILFAVWPRGGDAAPVPAAGDGEGRAEIIPADPVPAGSRGTWRVRFVCGPSGIDVGGGIVVQVSPYWGWTSPQTEAPGAPGFTTVTTNRAGTRLSAAASQLHYILITVLSERLAAGDTLTVVYGDTEGGRHPTAAAQADLYAERWQEFVVKTDGDGDGFFAEIAESPRVEILPREATQLVVHGKASARPGERLRLTVAFLDPYDNRAVGARGVVRLEADDPMARLPATVEFGPEDSGAVAVGVALMREGRHTIRALEEATGLRGRTAPILVQESADSTRLLWGDLHGHSAYSDGTGTPRDYYRYARDVTNLDFAALTDHDHHGLRPLPAAAWERIVAEANAAYAPGAFVTFIGYEWTNWTSGHRNVYYRGEQGALLSVGSPAYDTPQKLWGALDSLGLEAMTVAHHPAGGPVATDWSIAPPPEWEWLVEIASVHGSSEYAGCPLEVSGARAGSHVRDALARGYRLGIIAAGDGHTGHPGKPYGLRLGGLAGVYATEPTREAIWRALRERRVYGTSGARIHLAFTAGGVPMGGVVALRSETEAITCQVDAVGTVAIESIELVRDGEVIARHQGRGPEETLLHVDEAPGRVGSSLYARVIQVDGETAWSSPVWFERAATGPPAPAR